MMTINFVLALLFTSILAIAWEPSLPHYLRPQPINKALFLYYHRLYSTTTTATWLTDMGTKPT